MTFEEFAAARLPRRQRAVLVLRYYEGLSDPEIADALGCAPGTVRGYASRALAVLRVEMAGPARPAPHVTPAIELSETSHGPDVIEPLPTLLWVNARTHLPIRMINGVGSTTVTRDEWAYLPPTAANLKLLQVHIPPVTRVTSRSAEYLAWPGMAAWAGGPGVPPPRSMNFVIGLDPGTTGPRAVAVVADGRISPWHRRPDPCLLPEGPGPDRRFRVVAPLTGPGHEGPEWESGWILSCAVTAR